MSFVMSLLLCLYRLTMLWSLLLCLHYLFLFGPRPLGPLGPIFVFDIYGGVSFIPYQGKWYRGPPLTYLQTGPSFCNYFPPSYCNYLSPSYCIFFHLAAAIIFRLPTAIVFCLVSAINWYIDTFIVYTQKNLLCIHKRSLVHAQHSCACSGPGTPGARDPKKALGRSQALDRAFFGSLGCACTRDLLCIHKRFFCVYTINVFS